MLNAVRTKCCVLFSPPSFSTSVLLRCCWIWRCWLFSLLSLFILCCSFILFGGAVRSRKFYLDNFRVHYRCVAHATVYTISCHSPHPHRWIWARASFTRFLFECVCECALFIVWYTLFVYTSLHHIYYIAKCWNVPVKNGQFIWMKINWKLINRIFLHSPLIDPQEGSEKIIRFDWIADQADKIQQYEQNEIQWFWLCQFWAWFRQEKWLSISVEQFSFTTSKWDTFFTGNSA